MSLHDFEPVRALSEKEVEIKLHQKLSYLLLLHNADKTKLVTFLHDGIPRFGHSNNIACLVSSEHASVAEYNRGILSVVLFLITIPLIWIVVLLLFKFHRDFQRRNGAARNCEEAYCTIQQRTLESRRAQKTFFTGSICLIVTSIWMLKSGLRPVTSSLKDLQLVTKIVENRTNEAISATLSLALTYDNLNEIANSATLLGVLDVEDLCPDVSELNSISNTSVPSAKFEDDIMSGLKDIHSISLDVFVAMAKRDFGQLKNEADAAGKTINNLIEKEWIIKAFVAILNAITIFLILGWFFTKFNMESSAYQKLMSWALLPTFCSLMLATVIGASVFLMLAIASAGTKFGSPEVIYFTCFSMWFSFADFCAGGSSDSSPLGTTRDMLLQQETFESKIFSKFLDYYESNCSIENPFAFVDEAESKSINLQKMIQTIYDRKYLSDDCGTSNEMAANNLTIPLLMDQMNIFVGSLNAFLELTGCPSIIPIIRLLCFGSFCTDFVEGLTWMSLSMFAITIFGTIVLSARMALTTPFCGGTEGDLVGEMENHDEGSSQCTDVGEQGEDSLSQIVHLDQIQLQGNDPELNIVVPHSNHIRSFLDNIISRFWTYGSIAPRGYERASSTEHTNNTTVGKANAVCDS